ncbi:MAG: hypothetical protein ACQESB_01580, partial [Elusimicrobiota bacterium]
LPVLATTGLYTRWEGKNSSVSVFDNYGTPAGELLRAGNDREKAFHFFNLLESHGEKANVTFALTPVSPLIETDKVIEELDLNALEKELDKKLQGEEAFKPFYDSGNLYYKKWSEGEMGIEADGELLGGMHGQAFEFHGAYNGIVLAAFNGILKYMDGDEWLRVESLKDYFVTDIRYIEDSIFLVMAEDKMSSRRKIITTSIKSDEKPRLLTDDPGFKNIVVGRDSENIAGLIEEGEAYSILKYNFQQQQWSEVINTSDVIYLAGIKNGEIIWWNETRSLLQTSEGKKIEGMQSRDLSLYPMGEFKWGEEEAMYSASPNKIKILTYGVEQLSFFEDMGLSDTFSFDSKPGIWLINKRYKSSFDELPEKLGHAFLSPENSRIYYNRPGAQLRKIRSVLLRPSVRTKYLLAALIFILIILLLYDVMKKTKEVTS